MRMFPRKLKKIKKPKAARKLAKLLRKGWKRRQWEDARRINAFNVPTQWEMDYAQMMQRSLRNMVNNITRNNALYDLFLRKEDATEERTGLGDAADSVQQERDVPGENLRIHPPGHDRSNPKREGHLNEALPRDSRE